jgi:UDP:flavonoid glycosyltransferase YjiC (YdhE family)
MKVLAYTSPARSHLFPTVPILLEFQRRGHTVVLRTTAADVPTIRELGFTADPISPEIEAITQCRRTPGSRSSCRIRTCCPMPRWS